MTRPGRGGPEALDPWERGFDAGWLAAADGQRRRIRSGFRLFPDGYWGGWREGYRIGAMRDGAPERGRVTL